MTNLAEMTADRDALKASLNAERINAAFASSKFVADHLKVPAQMAAATFGRSFSFENDRLVARDGNGNQIMSRNRMGEPASFDEAIEAVVGAYEHRDGIMKTARGQSSAAWALPEKPMLHRSQFDALAPEARTAFCRAGGQLHD